MIKTVHEVRIQDTGRAPGLTVLCANYELGKWRDEALVGDLFDRHLTSFALSYTEWLDINGETAARAIRKAAKAIYATDKYQRRGEFGELILHAAAKDFFGAEPAVSKIYYKDSDNDTVKGFDCVHVVTTPDDIEVWLGEVKFYDTLGAAISDAAQSLEAHLKRDFLRREFTAITNKLDPKWPGAVRLKDLLDDATTLDDIIERLVIPVLLTYDSAAVGAHTKNCPEYEAALRQEAEEGWAKLVGALSLQFPVTLQLILVPLPDKSRFARLCHQKLNLWRHL